MAISSNLLQNVLETIEDSGNFNLIRFRELRYRDFPFKASNDFIESMIEIHVQLLKNLNELEKQPCNTDEDLNQKWIKARRYTELFNRLHCLLNILEMGGREYVPSFIAQVIEEKVKTINPKANLIFLPDYEYNFFYAELIAPLRETLYDALPSVDDHLSFARKVPIFWFPLAFKDNIMVNSLLGHEFGHFVNEEKGIVPLLMSNIDIQPREIAEIVNEKLRTKVTAEKKEIKMDVYFRAETMQIYTKKDVSAKIALQLKELVSDAVGFFLFGPVFLIAQFNYLASTGTLAHKPKGYPAVKTRLAFLMALFDHLGYAEKVKQKKGIMTAKNQTIAESYLAIIEELRLMLINNNVPSEDAEEALVDKSVQSIQTVLWAEVLKTIKGQEYSADVFCNDTFKLVDAIDSIVPPVEIEFEKPANRVSIMNAGMLYALTSMSSLYNSFEATSISQKLSTRNKLHKLIMKAGELSIIQESLQTNR
jgi:hypothetical protein